MNVAGGRRPGRGHRQAGLPCQDAFAVHEDPARRRAAAAVADGLGSQPMSHAGSQAACDAAVASLAQADAWDEAAIVQAFEAARRALEKAAAELAVPLDAVATTLQVAVQEGGTVRAAMVGDGAVVVAARGEPGPPAEAAAEGTDGTDPAAAAGRAADTAGTVLVGPSRAVLLLAPPETEYANEVVPLTASAWRRHLRFAEGPGDAALLFTDGLTRLLLTREGGAWAPFGPFFDSFLPRLREGAFDPGLVERFLGSDAVDRQWDDDKCMVVLAHGAR